MNVNPISPLRLAATCGAGTEMLVAQEISGFGGDEIITGKGVVSWLGDLASAYRACLWSRFASRIFLELATFPVTGEEHIYTGGSAVDWSSHFDQDTTFAVDCTLAGEKSTAIHSRFAALRIKDAVVDQFRERCGSRPSIDLERPGIRLHLLLMGDQATISLDLSGDSLHKRGYRAEKTLAPLKENLAAAIVAVSGWPQLAGPECPLIDPMCGSGTLLIEAALIYGDIAPGLSRHTFGFMAWKGHDRELWEQLVDEALAREAAGSERPWPLIIGYDDDPQAIQAARRNLRQAGLDDRIRIKQAELARLTPPAATPGLLVSNLPFGERLLEEDDVSWLYRALGRVVQQRFVGWHLAVFIANAELTDSFGLAWQNRFRLYNGALPCRLLSTMVTAAPESTFHWQLAPANIGGDGEDFVNRLRKNLKAMLKWAKKEGVSCFRIYDRDLPEYNVSVDIYEKWVHVQEYAPPTSIAPEAAAARFQLVLRGIRQTLGLRADRVFIKTRQRQRGRQQYQKKAARQKLVEVGEGNCRYLVNFTDYLDTGLFLDHRPLRLRIYREACGRRFLNLFGYTGTATVQAAAGGARSTTTVDLSATYCRWTRMNLAVNGLGMSTNRVVVADCLAWLRQDSGSYDLIFVDPPTFSNTKKERRVFDLQRDHLVLLELAMARLSDDGLLIFSNNFKGFKLDQRVEDLFRVHCITRETIPSDFARNQRVHQCWEIRKHPARGE